MGRFALARSLVFAAFAALGVIPWLLAWGHSPGRSWAIVIYAGAAAVLYLVALAPNLRQATRGGFLGVVLVAAALLLAGLVGSPAGALLLTSACLGVARSAFLYRRRAPTRALVLEVALLALGWGLAAAVVNPTPTGIASGFWMFFLTQSLFALVGDTATAGREKPPRDPFEVAREHALAVMGEPR